MMRDSYPQSISNLLNNDTKIGCCTPLSNIQKRARMLLKLNRAVDMQLQIPLRFWCQVSNLRQGVMVLETANASWLTRLRYEETQLLSALRAQILPSLLAIDIRINPSLAIKGGLKDKNYGIRCQNSEVVKKKQRRLSMQSAMFIRHVAMRSNGKLRSALERLAGLAGCNSPFRHKK